MRPIIGCIELLVDTSSCQANQRPLEERSGPVVEAWVAHNDFEELSPPLCKRSNQVARPLNVHLPIVPIPSGLAHYQGEYRSSRNLGALMELSVRSVGAVGRGRRGY